MAKSELPKEKPITQAILPHAPIEHELKTLRNKLASDAARTMFDKGVRTLADIAGRYPTIEGSAPDTTLSLRRNAITFFDKGGREIDRALRIDGIDPGIVPKENETGFNRSRTVGDLIASRYMEMVGCTRTQELGRK